MAEPFAVKKALDLSAGALGKSFSVVIKGLLVLAILAGLGWSVYVAFVKPHTKPTPTTSQSGVITNNYINPDVEKMENIVNEQVKKREKKFFIGVRLFGIDLGVGK